MLPTTDWIWMYSVIPRTSVHLFRVDTCKVKWGIKIIIHTIQAKMLLLKYPNNYGPQHFLAYVIQMIVLISHLIRLV